MSRTNKAQDREALTLVGVLGPGSMPPPCALVWPDSSLVLQFLTKHSGIEGSIDVAAGQR